jgi:hypothetical protein
MFSLRAKFPKENCVCLSDLRVCQFTTHHIHFNFKVQVIFNEEYNYNIFYPQLILLAVNLARYAKICSVYSLR